MYRITDADKSLYKNWEYMVESVYKEYPESVSLDFVPHLKAIE